MWSPHYQAKKVHLCSKSKSNSYPIKIQNQANRHPFCQNPRPNHIGRAISGSLMLGHASRIRATVIISIVIDESTVTADHRSDRGGVTDSLNYIPYIYMQFLRGSTLHLMQDLIPDIGSILTHRIVNYLSFYLSHSGQHLYYSSLLHSQPYLQTHFTLREQKHHQRGSNEHILAKMLLAAQFPEHVIDPKGTRRLMADLQALTHIEGKVRIAQYRISSNAFLKSSARMD